VPFGTLPPSSHPDAAHQEQQHGSSTDAGVEYQLGTSGGFGGHVRALRARITVLAHALEPRGGTGRGSTRIQWIATGSGQAV